MHILKGQDPKLRNPKTNRHPGCGDTGNGHQMEMGRPSHENGATTMGANNYGVGTTGWLETPRPTSNKMGRLLRKNSWVIVVQSGKRQRRVETHPAE